jgi:hypothetical protein
MCAITPSLWWQEAGGCHTSASISLLRPAGKSGAFFACSATLACVITHEDMGLSHSISSNGKDTHVHRVCDSVVQEDP